ncbi:unnamed protein product, partial [Prorocentrum cordatum]
MYKDSPEDPAAFPRFFQPHLRSAEMQLWPLRWGDLAQAACETQASACSSDQWRPVELRALGIWCLQIFEDLALILNYVEETGHWPRELTKAYVALAPKDDALEEPQPTGFRLISVLSAVYRLWSKVRFAETLGWQEGWCPDEMWGCRRHRGRETMAMAIALDLESAAYGGGKHVAGVSYDFKKAVDLIPIEIMLQAFNVIIQGDALSMIALNSIASCILETSGARAAEGATERSYADDISAATVAETPEAAKEEVRRFHGIVRAFTWAEGGEINLEKCFAVGDDCARGVLGDEVRRFRQFEIVGGSFAARESADAETELELQRLAKWKLTLGRIRHVPRSWRDRVGRYSLSPLVTFVLLAPAQLDAEFGAVYEGLRAVMRAMRVPALATTLKERFGSVPTARRDGPTLRLRVLRRSGAFGPLVGRLLGGAVTDKQTEGEWLRDLRDAWRRALWQRLVKERGRQYGGAEDVDRVRTMILHDRLQEQASADEEAQEEEAAEARAKLGALRRTLAGGLLTNERVGRHKKEGSLACACGAPEATVEHVTSPLTQRQSVLLQTFMLTVRRDQVQRWHRGDDLLQVADPEAPAPAEQEGAAAAALQGHAENGHHLERRVGADGLRCRKCGKFVQRTQHVRLKITGRRCEFPDLPPERWLQREGQRQAESRLDQLWRDTEERYNKGGHVDVEQADRQ